MFEQLLAKCHGEVSGRGPKKFRFKNKLMSLDARWAVELFFKAIKQNLKLKTFLGTSPNAVKTQTWTALIAMLLPKYLQLRSTFHSAGGPAPQQGLTGGVSLTESTSVRRARP